MYSTVFDGDVREAHARYFIERDGKGPFDYLGWCQYSECIESFQASAIELRENVHAVKWISEVLPKLREVKDQFDDFFTDSIAPYDGKYTGVRDNMRVVKELLADSLENSKSIKKSIESGISHHYAHTLKTFLEYDGPIELLLDPRIDEYFKKDLELYNRVADELEDVEELQACDYEVYIDYVTTNYPEIFDGDRYKESFANTKAEAKSTQQTLTIPLPDPVPDIETPPTPPSADEVRQIAREEVQKLLSEASETGGEI